MLPEILQEYLDMLRGEVPDHPYSQACAEQGIQEVDGNIEKLLREASLCTGMTETGLLKSTDFDENDPDPDRVQSLFGVLRTIIVLQTELGFSEIITLPHKKGRKEADLLAVRQGVRFAVEVARSSEKVYRFPGLTKGDFYKYVVNLWDKKEDQIRTSIGFHQCHKGILAIVLDSEPMKGGLMTPDELLTVVENAQAGIIWTNAVHLLLFTGEWYYGEGEPMTAVFPPLL